MWSEIMLLEIARYNIIERFAIKKIRQLVFDSRWVVIKGKKE